jgi:hypothetical protein
MAKSKLPVATSSASAKAVPVKIVRDEPMETAKDESRERKWRAEDALRDIERAEQHKRDKMLMGDVKKLAKEKVKSLNKVCGQ